MVIPGVSGSMMLMLLGYYEPVISSISGLVRALTALDGGALLYNAGILVPFGIGVVAGIFLIAKLIEILLARWEGVTYCAIIGLVSASPIAISDDRRLGAGHARRGAVQRADVRGRLCRRLRLSE